MVRLHHNKAIGEKARWKFHKNAMCCFEQILGAAPHKTVAVWQFVFYLPNPSSKMKKIILGTARVAETNSLEKFSSRHQYMNKPV